MNIEVLAPGLLTTVQDSGRTGFRHLGVGQAGALDVYAHAVANALVGNTHDAATLEITLAGPRLHFLQDTTVALCGANMDMRCNNTTIPKARPIFIPKGSTVHIGGCKHGARAYLAIAGGIDVPVIMGSRSTDLRGGFGGVAGRALQTGDVLATGSLSAGHTATSHLWWVDDAPHVVSNAPIRILTSNDTPTPALTEQPWLLTPASNRQGLRLQGTRLATHEAGERISAPVAPGTIQLPPDGQPIVLLADAQTHGGYPVIAHVIRADRPRLAQLRPGDILHFVSCTPQQAQQAWQQQQHELARLIYRIKDRLNN